MILAAAVQPADVQLADAFVGDGGLNEIDGAFALPLLLCFVAGFQRRYLPAVLCCGVAG